jgi:hypothetical protein
MCPTRRLVSRGIRDEIGWTLIVRSRSGVARLEQRTHPFRVFLRRVIKGKEGS